LHESYNRPKGSRPSLVYVLIAPQSASILIDTAALGQTEQNMATQQNSTPKGQSGQQQQQGSSPSQQQQGGSTIFRDWASI